MSRFAGMVCHRMQTDAFLRSGNFSGIKDPEIDYAGKLRVGCQLWVHLSLMEECRGRVEHALSGPAESRDAHRNMQLYAALGAALILTKGSCPGW
jgi:hypothetical protein